MVKEGSGPVTLRRLADFAAFLAKIRPLFVAAGLAAGTWLVFEILWGTGGSARALLALCAVLLAGIALAAGYTLPVLPRRVRKGDRIRDRMRRRLAQVAYGLALALCLGLLALTASLAFRALGVSAG